MSKKCPMCNTVNDTSADVCSYCGYIFEDVRASRTYADIRNSAASTVEPLNTASSPPGDPYPPQTSVQSIASPAPPTVVSTMTGTSPLFVFSNQLSDRRTLANLTVSVLGIGFFALTSGFLGYASFFPVIFFLPSIISFARSAISGRRYEFFEDSFLVTGRKGYRIEASYSQLSDVHALYRGNRGGVNLVFKDGRPSILVPGDPKSKILKTDLFSWLRQKVPQKPSPPQAEQQSIQEQPQS